MTILKRQFITDAEGKPVGIILPNELLPVVNVVPLTSRKSYVPPSAQTNS